MTDLLAHVVEHQGQNPNPQPKNPGNPGSFVESEDSAIERFQKFSPPNFNGGPDPDVTERWLEKMVGIFAALHYTEGRQKDLAVAQINAFIEAVEKVQRVESARLQVRNFQDKKRGFPGSSSGQGNKSTPPKFGRGIGGGRQPGMWRGAPPRGGEFGRGQRGSSQGGLVSASRGPCGYCGKPNHTEDNCWRKERKCLRCGSADHQIANCPVLPRDGKGGQQPMRTNSGPAKVEGTKPKVLARVYSLEPQQVPDSSDVVEGTILVFHRFAKVLVDPGATHSFVNPDFMCGIDIQP
ncbi:uncharacterized protein LOC113755660 [Coffea eugenioides]|uniref:uncharacterized protein LOC113755660 n=1 Tax=Coffea eugenioides TaxID=49369 RepID=UPI000F60B639|nr:uncharacterized protein LOC113755660 [Coffea eugenioides]